MPRKNALDGLIGTGPLYGRDLLNWFNRSRLTITEAAALCGCARSTLRHWIHPNSWDSMLSERMEYALRRLLKAASPKRTNTKLVWIPVFLWKDHEGKLRYDVHGVEDYMVSDEKKRADFEPDIWSAFLYDADENTPDWPGHRKARPEKHKARLTWIQVEISWPPAKIERRSKQ